MKWRCLLRPICWMRGHKWVLLASVGPRMIVSLSGKPTEYQEPLGWLTHDCSRCGKVVTREAVYSDFWVPTINTVSFPISETRDTP